MPSVEIDKLREGMIIARDIKTAKGQLLLVKDSVLTSQMITQLACYGIDRAFVTEGVIPPAAQQSIMRFKEVDEAYIKKLLKTPKFQSFKRNYFKSVDAVEISFNDIVSKGAHLDRDELLAGANNLFSENSDTAYALLGMLNALKTTDDSTYSHSVNVAIIARMIGSWVKMSDQELNDLTLGALLHDIGKCSIPEEILKKKGKLLPKEYELMKMHTTYGYGILRGQDLSPDIMDVALHHHERNDGSGYPHGLEGKDIGDYAAITAIADVYDAMTSPRSYRGAMCPFDVIATYEREGLQKYDARFITKFLRKIADSYINCEVMMNNGVTARIINTNQTRLTRPMLQLTGGQIIKLEDHPELYIQSIV
ncbi:MAG: HD-GYP domain-containing protein [Lachnospiraceae bacterium]|nr:HD-GYP domain-containing protein [Lachnospiraceae bacterium]